jgi:hypothetical protein
LIALEGIVLKGGGQEPVAGATVALWPTGACPGREAEPVEIVRTRSGPDGRFLVPGVKTGEFLRLRVEAPGYARDSTAIYVEEGQRRLLWKGGIVLEASADGRAFIEIRMDPAGTARGTVFDPFGNPVPRAEVFAVQDEHDGSWWEGWAFVPDRIEEVRRRGERAEAFRTVADERGKYSIGGMETKWRPYLFCAFDGQGHFGAANSVWFPEGALELTQDLRIRTMSALLVSMLSPDGGPLSGVEGAVERAGNFMEGEDWDPDEVELFCNNQTRRTTDPSGRIEVRSLPAGRYVVSAWPLDACPEARSVEIRDHQVSSVTLSTKRGGSVAGRVARADGGPMKNASVVVYSGKRDFSDGSSRQFDWRADLGPDGRFRRDGIPDGTVTVQAVSEGVCEGRVEARAGDTDLRIVLEPFPEFTGLLEPPEAAGNRGVGYSFGRSWGSYYSSRVSPAGRFSARWTEWRRDTDVFLTLRVSDWLPVVLGPFRPKPGEVIGIGTIRRPPERSLAGVVLDPAGAPCPGAKVAFEWAAVRDFKVEGLTGADGKFALMRVPLGEGKIRAVSDLFPAAEAAVPADGQGPIELRFRRAAFIRGRVVDSGGAPKPGAEISIFQRNGEEWIDRSGPWEPKSDNDGNFTSKPLPAGRYLVRHKYCDPKKQPRGQTELDLREGETAMVELEVK